MNFVTFKSSFFLGFVGSIVFIWIVGFNFCNSLETYIFETRLKKWIKTPGTSYKYRTEGYATSFRGILGINAIKNITEDVREKLVIWGDSYVEAVHVDDEFKLPQQISYSLFEKGLRELYVAFGIGMSGDSVVDYLYYIPAVEKTIDRVSSHYIIITHLKDTLPDQEDDTKRAIYLSDPFRISFKEWKPKHQKLKEKLNQFGLHWIWQPLKRIMASVSCLRFNPFLKVNYQIENKGTLYTNINYPDRYLTDAWEYLFKKIRNQTEKPVTIVYCPQLPRINDGLVETEDPDRDKLLIFQTIAKGYDIEVISVEKEFVDFYILRKRLPRGFCNSLPGVGHFNRYGHKLVANSIFEHFIEKLGK